jgi:hypothetical protein
MENDLKDSGVVTVLSVIGFVFGLIGMLGSFIPCIGGIAFAIGIPAALLSALSVIIAYASHAKKTFAIVALTISLIGVVISGWQFITIRQAGKLFEKEISKSQHTSNDSKLSPRAHSATTTPSQADKWQVKSWDDCFSDLKSAISSKNREKIKKILLNMQGKYKSEFDKQDPSMVFRYNYDYWTSAALFMIGKYDNNDYLDLTFRRFFKTFSAFVLNYRNILKSLEIKIS